jgi:hypothetical protein
MRPNAKFEAQNQAVDRLARRGDHEGRPCGGAVAGRCVMRLLNPLRPPSRCGGAPQRTINLMSIRYALAATLAAHFSDTNELNTNVNR